VAVIAVTHTITVLVVESEPSARELACASVPTGWRVLEARSGSEALRMAKAEPVDLVVLGLPLPDADGLEVCRELERRSGQGPLLPVLVLTADGGRDPKDAALAAGADDVLAKPVDPQALALRLRVLEHLREHERLVHDREDELSALVAHDLRNPLCAAAGILGMLRKEATDPSLREDLDTAFSGVTRAREILDDLLRARMLEVGAIAPVRGDCDLAQLASAAAKGLAGAAAEQGVELIPPRSAGPMVQADPDLLGRAVEILVANAVRYARRGTAVEISTRADGGERIVEIADRGPVVPDALKQTIFEKFGPVAAARGSARRGYGLALHLVWLVATLHGGSVRVRDREGGGNVFLLALPAATQ